MARARKSPKLQSAMASLGSVTAAGPAALETGTPGTYTAAISEAPEDAVLTWEGVGCDLYDAATGGLTGDQDHEASVGLTFTKPGNYQIKAGYSSLTADNSPQYSEPLAIIVEAPVPAPPAELDSNAQYQVASIVYWYRRWHNRDLVVTPSGSSSFTLTPGGKLGNGGKIDNLPTEGEKKYVADWLKARWDGDLSTSGDAITLTCVGSGNFHPGGGGSPRSVTGA